MKHLQAIVVLAVAVAPAAGGEKALPPVDLPAVHVNASATLRLHTPRDWTVRSAAGDPELTEAKGGGLILRILKRNTELGLDAMHVDCMLVRLAPETQVEPGVRYEYDFVGGAAGDRRALDSAFLVRYDEPVEGSREWRQRNLTLVGGGESLCVIAYAPMPAWKKSKELKRLLDAVLASVEFKPWR